MENLVFYKSDVQPLLRILYRRTLDRTFADNVSFLALQSFQTEIEFTTRIYDEISLKSVIRRAKEELPSVFGPGGRRQLYGWNTVVRAKLGEYINPDSFAACDERSDGDETGDEDEDQDDKIHGPEVLVLTDTGSLDLKSESSDSE